MLFVCYILNYIDRVNVGYAKLQMQSDLQLSDIVYGAGAGIFFKNSRCSASTRRGGGAFASAPGLLHYDAE